MKFENYYLVSTVFFIAIRIIFGIIVVIKTVKFRGMKFGFTFIFACLITPMISLNVFIPFVRLTILYDLYKTIHQSSAEMKANVKSLIDNVRSNIE